MNHAKTVYNNNFESLERFCNIIKNGCKRLKVFQISNLANYVSNEGVELPTMIEMINKKKEIIEEIKVLLPQIQDFKY